jgi:hypothetical protein
MISPFSRFFLLYSQKNEVYIIIVHQYLIFEKSNLYVTERFK